jgi:predicted dehydrogenase
MSNYLEKNNNSDIISNLNSLDFTKKSILLIGAGWMASQHADTLSKMKINDVTVIDKNQENLQNLCNKFHFKGIHGDFNEIIPKIEPKDLVIICTPIHLLLLAAQKSIDHGQTNILIEKPGSLYKKELNLFLKKITTQRIRIGYNRFCYPAFHKLLDICKNDEKILSCHFTFTEWIHTINFSNNLSDTYARWGISNSLHVISMAFGLIGLPKTISSYQSGILDWHPSGSIFTGSGITENNIPFSYHANWKSSGRWGIEIMTTENSYRLIPLEKLRICSKGSVEWKELSLDSSYKNTKPGLSEEIAVMLDSTLENKIPLITLEKAIEFNEIAEKIFNYSEESYPKI